MEEPSWREFVATRIVAMMCVLGGPMGYEHWLDGVMEKSPVIAITLFVNVFAFLGDALARRLSPGIGTPVSARALLGYAVAAALLAMNVDMVMSWAELPVAGRSPLRVMGLATGLVVSLKILLGAIRRWAASATSERNSYGPVQDAQVLFLEISFLIAALASLSTARLEALIALLLFGVSSAWSVGIATRQASSWATKKRVLHGEQLQTRATRLPALVSMGWTLGVGGGLFFLLRQYGAPSSWLTILAVLTAVAALVIGRLGHRAGGSLEFSDAHLLVNERRYSFAIPWRAISQVTQQEWLGDPRVAIALKNSESVQTERPQHRRRFEEAATLNRFMGGTDVLLDPTEFGLSTAGLLTILEARRAT